MEKILSKSETKEKALRLITFRSHSEKELREKLQRAGSLGEDIDEAVEFLYEYQFLDDRKFATSKARDMQHLKKFGKARIKMELKKLGIPYAYIEEAIEGLTEDEEENLAPLVFKRLKGNFEKNNIDKTIRYFITRGYELGQIKKCINDLKLKMEGQIDEL